VVLAAAGAGALDELEELEASDEELDADDEPERESLR
jgi:hypothetical protein